MHLSVKELERESVERVDGDHNALDRADRRDDLSAPVSGRFRKVWFDLMLAVGLSGLLLSHNAATQLSRANVYFTRDSQQDLLTGWLITLALFTAINFGGIRAWRSSRALREPLFYIGIVLGVIGVLNFERSLGLDGWRLGAVFGLSLAAAVVAIRRAKENGGTIRRFLMLFEAGALFTAVTVVWALWAIAHPYHAPQYEAATQPDAKAPIVWIVFDELDQGWLFDHRPAGVKLPEFDAFRNQAVYFPNANRPGPETVISLPALLTGRHIEDAAPSSPTQLMVRYAGASAAVPWSASDTVFAPMKDLGRHSSLVGFYHNYAPIFGGTVSHIRAEGFIAYGMPAAVEFQLLELIPGAPRTALEEWIGDPDLWNQACIAEDKIRLRQQLADSRAAIENWRTGMIFLHICLPHAPWTQGHYDSSHQGYLSNLALTDQFLGQIRQSLQKMNEWKEATVVITADHNFRQPLLNSPLNQKVPLLVKMAGQTGETDCPQPVDAVNERWLVEAIAKGQVTSAEQAAKLMVDRSRPNQ